MIDSSPSRITLQGCFFPNPLMLINLPEAETLDIFLTTGTSAPTFGLMYSDVTFLRTDDGHVRVFDSWDRARRTADQDDLPFIVKFKEQRVMFRYVFASGKSCWYTAITVPHPSLEALVNSVSYKHSYLAGGFEGV